MQELQPVSTLLCTKIFLPSERGTQPSVLGCCPLSVPAHVFPIHSYIFESVIYMNVDRHVAIYRIPVGLESSPASLCEHRVVVSIHE